MKSLVRGRIMRSSKPLILSGRGSVEVALVGIKPRLVVTVQTYSHKMRREFFHWCDTHGIDLTRVSFVGKVSAETDLDRVSNRDDYPERDILRKEYIRESSHWGQETQFDAISTGEALLALMESGYVIATEMAMDVRPPRGSKPPAFHLPQPPARRENGTRIPYDTSKSLHKVTVTDDGERLAHK